MTLWFCDRCGKQVERDSNFAGKYNIQKTFYEEEKQNGFTNGTRRVQRSMKFCDTCSMEMEKFLDDEFAQMPVNLTGDADRRC